MGIDARMFVRTSKPVTDEEIRDLAYRLVEGIGPKHFFLDREGRYGVPRHALSRLTEFDQDGPTLYPGRGETFIGVHLAGRYYGPGYERGDLPVILVVATWLEAAVPGAEMWYGGDSSGATAAPFGPTERAALFEHFVHVGHRPYDQGFGLFCGDGSPPPICEFCARPMFDFGGGGGRTFFSCGGCGIQVQRRDATGALAPYRSFDALRQEQTRILWEFYNKIPSDGGAVSGSEIATLRAAMQAVNDGR